MQRFQEGIAGKKVLVFGLGKQGGGQGDLTWLKEHGADVRVADRDRALAPNGEREEDIEWAEMIIKNPGVPDDHPLLLLAKKLQKPVLTSIAVFVKYAPLKIIGVTGTRGKSTTTALIAALLERAFPNQVVTGGNIPGTSGLALLDQLEGKKYAVLELSSFQLHNFHDLKISPDIAVVTNLYPDHLNRYKDMSSYQQDKEAIVAYQEEQDVTLANQDNPGAVAIAQASTGQVRYFSADDVREWQTSLSGSHNRENIAAMWAVGKALGIPEELGKQVVQDFHGLPYRLERVRTWQGITFVNDTTATTPTATLKALAAQQDPTILICGGATKNLPYDNLVQELAGNPHLVGIIFLGSRQIPDFTRAVEEVVPQKVLGQVDTMVGAVKLALDHSKPGYTILLSPGFASFDLFENEFDRGRQFNEIVKKV